MFKDSKPDLSKKLKNTIKKTHPIEPLHSGKDILKDPQRLKRMHDIEQAGILNSDKFNILCKTLFITVADYFQLLPETTNNYYTGSGGLIDHALIRTEAALNLFKEHLILEPKSNAYSEPQQLWNYVLLSASMLKGIGKLFMDFKIDLYGTNQEWLRVWNPLFENPVQSAKYFQYEYTTDNDVTLRKRLNLMMAQHLMPQKGLEWITASREAFSAWLALLNEDYFGAETLGAILSHAESLALKKYFDQLLEQLNQMHPNMPGKSGGFLGVPQQKLDNLEHTVGIKFMQWMHNELANGNLVLNKTPLVFAPGGLLMGPELFQWFMRDNPQYKSLLAVQTGFLSLGLHLPGMQNQGMHVFDQIKKQGAITGWLIANFAAIFPHMVHLFNPNTGQTQKISTTELIHNAPNYVNATAVTQQLLGKGLKYLSPQGTWDNNKELEAKHINFLGFRPYA